MWVGNLMWAAGETLPASAGTRAAPTEAECGGAACQEIVAACREHQGTVVLVTNEVGLGVIPDNDGGPPATATCWAAATR